MPGPSNLQRSRLMKGQTRLVPMHVITIYGNLFE